MFRRGESRLVRGMAAAAVLACASFVSAQGEQEAAVPETSEIERYLAERGLRELLAAHLQKLLRESDGRSRLAVADRLGKLYVELLDSATTAEARQRWHAASLELLKSVPEADSFDLRVNLTKVSYLRAEAAAERRRLGMATPEEVQEALGILRSAAGAFKDIGTKVHRRVEGLERREETGRTEDLAEVRTALADARRLRSLAMYYAGWAHYYLAFLEDKSQPAEEALTEFGWLLNAGGGKAASVERLPASLLRYEHVARAALGSALCESQRGNDDTALRWLDAVEQAEEVSPTILDQVFARRVAVLARARRWADLELIVRRARTADPGKRAAPLPLGVARLLAVLSLEALERDRVQPRARELVQRLTETAMADLIELGEARHVLDLVSRYGTAPLAGEGFIVNYVRGMQAYERARGSHAATGQSLEEPSTSDPVRNSYAQAAASLEVAIAHPEAAAFPAERTNAGLLMGLAFFYAGEFERAADRLERVFQAATDSKQAEEALWLAVVAMDTAVESGRPSLKDRRNRIGALFLRTYPRTERAAKLLLRQASEGLVTEEDAVAILLSVDRESPLHDACRRLAASLLYSIYRRARGTDRDFAAVRFAQVAEESLAVDRIRTQDPDDATSRQAIADVVVRVRQILDAVLGMTTPDLQRAERALAVLEAVGAYAGADLGDVRDELVYRRLQIALGRGDRQRISERLEQLYAIGGRFADAAARLMYREVLSRWNAAPDDAAAAREVVRHGLRVIGQFSTDPKTLSDPAVYSLYSTVAGAAALLWSADNDGTMRDVALRLDRALLTTGAPTGPVLRRFAEVSEAAGDDQAALDAWRSLMTGLAGETEAWYEARYHSLRLLAGADPVRAREAMDQHRVLHTDYGPPPWGERLRELDARIPRAPTSSRAGEGGGG